MGTRLSVMLRLLLTPRLLLPSVPDEDDVRVDTLRRALVQLQHVCVSLLQLFSQSFALGILVIHGRLQSCVAILEPPVQLSQVLRLQLFPTGDVELDVFEALELDIMLE